MQHSTKFNSHVKEADEINIHGSVLPTGREGSTDQRELRHDVGELLALSLSSSSSSLPPADPPPVSLVPNEQQLARLTDYVAFLEN
jgi:hypothetical protein